MQVNIVTERFLQCLAELKSNKLVPSNRNFALSIDIHPQCISDITKGKRNVTLEMVRKAIEVHDFNPSFLYSGEGSYFKNQEETFHDSDKLTVVVSRDNKERIVHVPIEAQAGYTDQINDPIYFQELPTFSLPDNKYQSGTYRCFDVKGDSMEPTLFSGDRVVCSYIETINWVHQIKENFVYVIITNTDVLVKRVKNHIKENGTIELLSDNSYYNSTIVEVEDLKEIWHVNTKISPFMPSPNNIRNGFSEDFDDMKETIEQQSMLIKNLNGTIEKLLKQNRSNK